MFRYLLILCVVLPSALVECQAATSDRDTAAAASEILKTHCYGCHGKEFEVPGFDVLDRDSLVEARSDRLSYVLPGNLQKSMLWHRVAVDQDMPPEKVKTRLSSNELEIIREWIIGGARFPTTRARGFIDESSVLRSIRNDLQNLAPETRRHQRYLSLHVISNNPKFSDADVRLVRAAVTKLLNSVSRSSRIINPPMIDASADQPYEGTIFRVDLRDFGWTASDWQLALVDYPFGLSWNDSELRALSQDIEQFVGPLVFDGIPYVRADWFVAKASRPATYHALLNIPTTVQALETRLGVDQERDFLQDRLQRAGFASSSVSHQNRLIDRHEGSITRYYYRSYDFDKAFGRGVLYRFPLGPRFDRNTHDQFAFEHAGGEIIWNLPNGLQGYMLVDAKGNRIDKGPIEIVRDLREIAGSPQIVNGISCIGCHRDGLHEYRDMVSKSQSWTSVARTKVERLYVDDDRLETTLRTDRKRFVAALEQAMGPYLRIGESADKSITHFAEPISTVAQWYDQDMKISDVAAELGFEDSTGLDATIRYNQKLKDLGLGPLPRGSTIPRRMWDTQEESPSSIFQRTAVALGLGSGLNPN